MKTLPSQERGFALFAVVVMLLLMSAAVAIALDGALSSLQASSGARVAETVRGGLGAGLDQAIIQISQTDAVEFRSPQAAWDMDDPAFAGFVGQFTYPPNATWTVPQQYSVRIGATPVQTTRSPPGEDVTNSYGAVIEVQIEVEVDSGANPAATPNGQRVNVGVVVPRQRSGT